MPWWDKADDWILAYVTLARIHLARGERSQATEAVERATELVRTRGVFPEARHAAQSAQVRLWLAGGDLQAAGRWAASLEPRDGFRFEHELTHMARARVWIAQHRPTKALALLSHLEKAARSAGRIGRVIEILILQALALQKMGDPSRAIEALEGGLILAQPEGYLRLFVDEGPPMQGLLAQWLAHAGPGAVADYATSMLARFEAEPSAVQEPQAASPAGVGPALVEALSPRELEVLHLIALGRSNSEIAQQLVVALGTIKAHTSHIYRKLDVANRTAAVARARQLGILP
jgi:LuxR family maltose regulon positive regulatory protein